MKYLFVTLAVILCVVQSQFIQPKQPVAPPRTPNFQPAEGGRELNINFTTTASTTNAGTIKFVINNYGIPQIQLVFTTKNNETGTDPIGFSMDRLISYKDTNGQTGFQEGQDQVLQVFNFNDILLNTNWSEIDSQTYTSGSATIYNILFNLTKPDNTFSCGVYFHIQCAPQEVLNNATNQYLTPNVVKISLSLKNIAGIAPAATGLALGGILMVKGGIPKPKVPQKSPTPTPSAAPKSSPLPKMSGGTMPKMSGQPMTSTMPKMSGQPAPKQSSGPQPKPSQGTSPKQSSGPQPQPSSGPGPKQSSGPQPQPSSGPGPKQSSGPQPQPSSGPQPQPSSGPGPKQSSGPQPQPSQGVQPQPSQGPGPKQSTGPQPQPSGGVQPQPSGGVQPQPSGGVQPQPSQGTSPKQSSGPQPQPSGGVQPQPSSMPMISQGSSPKQSQGAPQTSTMPMNSGGVQPQPSGAPQTSVMPKNSGAFDMFETFSVQNTKPAPPRPAQPRRPNENRDGQSKVGLAFNSQSTTDDAFLSWEEYVVVLENSVYSLKNVTVSNFTEFQYERPAQVKPNPVTSQMPKQSAMPKQSGGPQQSAMPKQSGSPKQSAMPKKSGGAFDLSPDMMNIAANSPAPKQSGSPKQSAMPKQSGGPQQSSMPKQSGGMPKQSAMPKQSGMPKVSPSPNPVNPSRPPPLNNGGLPLKPGFTYLRVWYSVEGKPTEMEWDPYIGVSEILDSNTTSDAGKTLPYLLSILVSIVFVAIFN